MRVADYVAQWLYERGVRHVFLISGGGAMHLNDAIGRHDGLSYVCNHHEQACAIAAEGYYRASGRVAAVQVTSGPGGTNTLTGVLGQWCDSIPALYISGQVKQETTVEPYRQLGLRQLGDQEARIVDIVAPITKYAAIVKHPSQIRMELEKALFIATSGRPGPVWLDVPMDIQGAQVEPGELRPFVPEAAEAAHVDGAVAEVLRVLAGAKRPLVVAGHGIRLAGAQDVLLRVLDRMGTPVLCTFNGFDLVRSDHPLFVGRPGTIGTRAGNFALQNADVLLSIGTRNNIRQVSYNWKAFARSAKKIIVDIDASELNKPTVRPDLGIAADAKIFLETLEAQLGNAALPSWTQWSDWCRARRERYPALRDHAPRADKVHPYVFMETLTRCLPEGATVVTGDGTACVAYFQAGSVKRGQRVFWNSGCASMGYDLPAAIGACVALGRRDVVCIAGDGSLQMNLQELQTAAHHALPLKLFVLNNAGYQSIRQTQDSYFGGAHVGCSHKSGVSFPDILEVAAASGLPGTTIAHPAELEAQIRAVLATPGPIVCEVRLDVDYVFSPKLSSEKLPDGRLVSKPLEDLAPFLPRDEFLENMLVPVWTES